MIKNILPILMFLIASSCFSVEQKGIFVGSVQFPPTILNTPNIRIYYAGHTIIGEINNIAKKVVFSIPEHKQRAFFYIVITPEIAFTPGTTVPCLMLKPNVPYRFFALQRIAYEPKNKKRHTDPGIEYAWIINELSLAPTQGRLPDDTIIICYNPDFIEGFQGGNVIEFPKLMIKKDIVKLVGSEEKLEELSNKWFIAANQSSDIIHDTVQTSFVVSSQPKTILAMIA